VSADGVTSAMKLQARIRIKPYIGRHPWIFRKDYMKTTYNEALWEWHTWNYSSDERSVLFFAIHYDRPDIFMHAHASGAILYDDLKESYTTDLHLLRYMLEIGFYHDNDYPKHALKYMMKPDVVGRYYQLISRFAPKHIPHHTHIRK